CKLYESIGNLNYIKLNKLDYEKNDVDSLLSFEEEVNRQIQETVDLYDTFKSTYGIQFTAEQVRKMPLTFIKVPETFTDDFLPNFTFHENAYNSKIYLGKIISSK